MRADLFHPLRLDLLAQLISQGEESLRCGRISAAVTSRYTQG